jgi:hypothetical protein
LITSGRQRQPEALDVGKENENEGGVAALSRATTMATKLA